MTLGAFAPQARESADDFTRRMDAQEGEAPGLATPSTAWLMVRRVGHEEAAPELSIAPGDKKVVGDCLSGWRL